VTKKRNFKAEKTSTGTLTMAETNNQRITLQRMDRQSQLLVVITKIGNELS
jgi:hypothetical protein